jgi:two-component system cell cycle sensor histidine kinase/response regulator CckA
MRRRVLLIEDEAFVARAFARYLEEHEVCVASGGREALLLLGQDPHFDVIICDLSMPDMDGMMVHEAIAASHPGLERRMVFCSGGAQSPRVREFLARTKVPLVEKPLSGAALRAAVLGVVDANP